MKLLLVEDSQRLQRSLTEALRRSGHAVDQALDGDEALRYARHNEYDLVILDLMIPKRDGFEVLETMRSQGDATRVLILSARDAVGDRVSGLDLGADDYLTKPFSIDELLARINALTRRANGVASPTLEVGDLVLHTATRRVYRDEEEIMLTRREYMLLECLARKPGSIVTRHEIEQSLYDEHDFPMSNAVDRMVCALRKKINQPGSPVLIETRRGLGYVLDPRSVA